MQMGWAHLPACPRVSLALMVCWSPGVQQPGSGAKGTEAPAPAPPEPQQLMTRSPSEAHVQPWPRTFSALLFWLLKRLD